MKQHSLFDGQNYGDTEPTNFWLVYQTSNSQFYRFILIILVLTFTVLSGCSTVTVSKQSTAQAIMSQAGSIITSDSFSQTTRANLLNAGLTDKECLADISTCLNKVENTAKLSQTSLYATLSEIHLGAAKQVLNQKQCKAFLSQTKQQQLTTTNNQTGDEQKNTTTKQAQATQHNQQICLDNYMNHLLMSNKFAYIYLFFNTKDTNSQLFNHRRTQVINFFAVSTNQFTTMLYHHYPMSYHYRLGKHQINLNVDKNTLDTKTLNNITDVITTDELSFDGLNSMSQRDGIGISLVALLKNAASNYSLTDTLKRNLKQDNLLTVDERIHQSDYLTLSVLLYPKGNTLNEVVNNQTFNLDIHNPYLQKHVMVANKSYPLAANFSASYGLWLADTYMESQAYYNLLGADNAVNQPHLYMLSPFDPNKRVIIMLHGLASSPATWVNVTNDVFADPLLRDNYQVWQVFYATNLPILENRLQINQLIEQTFAQVDPTGQHKASEHAVLIGHSMGGVIGRLLLSDTNLATNLPVSSHQLDDLNKYWQLKPITQVDRAVFISAPFRGTAFADRWFTVALRKIISLPSNFVSGISHILMNIDAETQQLIDSLFLQNGASQLSDQSSFMQLTKNVTISPKVTYHSIMADNREDKTKKAQQTSNLNDYNYISDGVVPYKSSHLAGAASEKILTGGHSIQYSPEAVLELRRILRQHLAQVDGIKAPKVLLPPTTTPDKNTDYAPKP